MSQRYRVGLILAIVLFLGTQALLLFAVGASDAMPLPVEEGGTESGGVTGEDPQSIVRGGFRFIHGGPNPCTGGAGFCNPDV